MARLCEGRVVIVGRDVQATTDSCPFAAVKFKGRPHHGIQFHPEVVHTEHGSRILRNFLFSICGCSGDWRMASFIEEWVTRIKDRVGDGHAICGVSGASSARPSRSSSCCGKLPTKGPTVPCRRLSTSTARRKLSR